MNARRGISLIELLATLSLLTLLSVVSISWMTTILKSQSVSEVQSNWARASSSVLDLIGQDLLTVDRLDTGGRGGKPRVIAEEHLLQVRTRNQFGVGEYRYTYERGSGELYRHWNSNQTSHDQIPLLGQIESFVIQLNTPTEQQIVPSLLVTIFSTDGQQIQRTYLLDREDVQ